MYVCVCMCVCLCMYVCMYVCVCVCVSRRGDEGRKKKNVTHFAVTPTAECIMMKRVSAHMSMKNKPQASCKEIKIYFGFFTSMQVLLSLSAFVNFSSNLSQNVLAIKP